MGTEQRKVGEGRGGEDDKESNGTEFHGSL